MNETRYYKFETASGRSVVIYLDGIKVIRIERLDSRIRLIPIEGRPVVIDPELIAVIATFVDEFRESVAIDNRKVSIDCCYSKCAESEICCYEFLTTIFLDINTSKFVRNYDEEAYNRIKSKLKKLLAMRQ